MILNIAFCWCLSWLIYHLCGTRKSNEPKLHDRAADIMLHPDIYLPLHRLHKGELQRWNGDRWENVD